MALTNDEKEAMRAATHDAAAALLDDLNYMQGALANRRPTGGDVRRLSGVIRRLLLDGHLQAVAAPRIGRMKLQVPDFEHRVTDTTFDFITLGPAPMFGYTDHHGLLEFYRIDEMGVVKDNNAVFQTAADVAPPMRDVTIQGLLSDRVIRVQDATISRADLLKFVCYHDFGVHYTGREEAVFGLIRRVRNILTFFSHPTGVLGIKIGDHMNPKKPARMLVDLAHIHTFSTGYYLAKSADVLTLKSLIESEIASAEGAAENSEN